MRAFYLLNGPNAKVDILVKLFRECQEDALQHAAQTVHNISRGTKSEERSIAIDESRDAILEEIKFIK